MNKTQMLQEEQELEARLFGTPKAPETTDASATSETKDDLSAPDDGVVVATEVIEPEVETEDHKKEEDWKLRFTNLRNSRDSKLYDAQVALASSESTVALLQQKVQELLSRKPEVAEDLFKDAFTAEEREALGETAIAAMQKTASIAAESKTAAIAKELAEARANAIESAKATAKHSASTAYETFTNRLAAAVPNFREVDMDPAFKTFMDSADHDGNPRSVSFLAAEGRGDVADVARHMKDFLAKENPKAVAKAKLSSKVNPTGVATTQAVTKIETNGDLSMKEINAHYKKHALGGYKGKHSEYLAMEKRIDAAAVSGRIKG